MHAIACRSRPRRRSWNCASRAVAFPQHSRLPTPMAISSCWCPQGPRELSALASCLKVSDLVVSDHLGCLREGEGVWRCGDTLLIAEERGPVANIGGLRAPGFRYLTVQVWDCVTEHTVSWLASPTSHLRLLIDVWSLSA